RTDLYSLGVTLYEMLTLTPAYTERDHAALLQQIARQDPAPIRSRSPSVPIELETIVHKAMAKEPAERYASGAALAEDLQRFLDDRPILARRPTLMERAAKFARRHRTLVRAVFAGAILAAVGLAVSTYLIWQEKKETELAYEKEAEQRRAATKLQAEAET